MSFYVSLSHQLSFTVQPSTAEPKSVQFISRIWTTIWLTPFPSNCKDNLLSLIKFDLLISPLSTHTKYTQSLLSIQWMNDFFRLIFYFSNFCFSSLVRIKVVFFSNNSRVSQYLINIISFILKLNLINLLNLILKLNLT